MGPLGHLFPGSSVTNEIGQRPRKTKDARKEMTTSDKNIAGGIVSANILLTCVFQSTPPTARSTGPASGAERKE